MKYIETFRDGEQIRGIYLCKSKNSAVTKNGKQYDNVSFQDKTGVIDGKIWDPNSGGIMDFGPLDYVEINGEITTFNGTLQLNVRMARKVSEDSVDTSDYFPCSSKDIEEMYQELMNYISSINNKYLSQLLKMFFVEDEEFAKKFKMHSAAKTIHHSFIGGLLEHTLSVTKLCNFYAKMYPLLNRDLLLTAAIFHDLGKVYELSGFPMNDYTDEGQLLGHIVVGCEKIGRKIEDIPGFPEKLARELKHCILAHHGELEYGSPKKPALMEAFALNMADNTDAKLETLTEIFSGRPQDGNEWYGYNRMLETNLRRTEG